MGTINSSMQAVQQAQADLGYVDNPPPLGHDLVSLLYKMLFWVRCTHIPAFTETP